MNFQNQLKNIGLLQAAFLSVLIHVGLFISYGYKLHPKIQQDLDISFMPGMFETSDSMIQKKSMQQETVILDDSLLAEKAVKKNIDQIEGRPGANQVADNKFIDLLSKHIAKFQRYPRHAQRRGWQGKVVLEIKLTGSGALIEKKINISSGFKILDNEGLNMIDRALPLPLPLEVMEEKIITIYVPIRFFLNNNT